MHPSPFSGDVPECGTHAQHRKRLFTSPKGRDREKLLEIQIERIFLADPLSGKKNRGTYGVRRIHNKLAEESIRTSLRRVRRIMRRLNLVANDNPKPLVREHIHRANIVCQNFKTSEKNHPSLRQGVDRVWLSDITYVKVREF
ncbi:MAG: IS3 family transposase [Brevinema sp.]